jgi:hypothetical protein
MIFSAPLVRVTGMARLRAQVYEIERLRCGLCGTIYATQPRTSNLEPRTSNLEPRTSNLELPPDSPPVAPARPPPEPALPFA